MPILEDDPRVMLAFEVLAGEHPIPHDKNRTSLLKYHQSVLRVAMDRAWESWAGLPHSRQFPEPPSFLLAESRTDTPQKP
jgi:hypothetical protein